MLIAARLALAWGYRSPVAVLRELTSADLAWWRAYFDMEPRGEERDDWRTADLAAHLIHCQTGTAVAADELRLRFIPQEAPAVVGEVQTERRRQQLKEKLKKRLGDRGQGTGVRKDPAP